MKTKKIIALVLSVLLIVSVFAGCDIIKPQFADYDVSGYIKALFDSSYLGSYENYMSYAKTTISEAEEKNNEVVQNGAARFCNTYNIFPSDEQMTELESIIRRAYKFSKFIVKDEQKSDTGYYVEVEIQPLLVFKNLAEKFEIARTSADKGELEGQVKKSDLSSEESKYNSNEDSSDEESNNESSEASQESQDELQNASEYVDENTAFVNEVIKLCNNALNETSQLYDPAVIVTLNIIQTDEGELQMDLVQIEGIDETVILYTK